MKLRCVVSFIVIFLFINALQAQERSAMVLDEGWRFKNAEVEQAAAVNFNDADWEKINVPHDWAIKGNFDMNLDAQLVQVVEDGDRVPRLRTGRTGALPMFGIGWYRKVLPVTTADRDKRVFIEFDGAMSLAKVYLNGKIVGEWPYGYASFSFELTPYLQYDKENVLAVRLENKPESSRWYAGAGIYRNVRLVKTPATHVAHWGTYITTPKITSKSAEINIQTEINGVKNQQSQVRLVTDIYAKSGEKVASVTSGQVMQGKMVFTQKTTIKNPKRWSLQTPHLYTAISQVYVDNILKDEYKTTFGCRTIRFDKDKGFFLNEQPVKIQGVCMHHDLGPIGAAVNYRATQRQVEMMKEMGANAIRTAHNPPSPELVQICDSMGILLQVEAFDEWKHGKNLNGYNLYFEAWAERDIRNMVRRDRNQPSLIMWSIGNEMREQGRGQEGKDIATFLARICREEDPTRPVTAGFNNHINAIKNGLTDVVDLVGFNYKPHDYQSKHKENPHYVLYGSETASTVSSRGEYKFPVKESKTPWYNDYHVSSYDMEYPRWASTPDTEFVMQDDNEFIFGEFVWTGFDYLGEPTPYNEGTPARSSYFGIVDLAGLKKDRFYLYQSKWSETPVLHLLPHWNWHDRLGQNVPVFCYTNYPKAELFVNGKSMGIKQKDKSNKYTRYRLMWNDVVYQPGEIKVIAYNDKNEAVAEQVIRTAGETFTVKMTPDRSTFDADGKDLSFITIDIIDKDGNLCPRANNLLFFEVTGAGKLRALCNGDPTDQTSFGSNYMRAFNGKIVATIESAKEPGEIELKVTGGLLKSQSVIISTQAKK